MSGIFMLLFSSRVRESSSGDTSVSPQPTHKCFWAVLMTKYFDTVLCMLMLRQHAVTRTQYMIFSSNNSHVILF